MLEQKETQNTEKQEEKTWHLGMTSENLWFRVNGLPAGWGNLEDVL